MAMGVFLLSLLCLIAAAGGSGSGSPPEGRQVAALNKLYYDATSLLRKAVAGPSSERAFLVSDSTSKAHTSHGSKENDKIVELPGQPEGVDFNQYGGYITVDGEAGRALFYYFAEAAGDPSSRPLLLWLNGGPGCSSLGYGAMEELGPFRVMSDRKTLHRNPYAWNTVANVLFLESPAGVGFSYSNTTADYGRSGDQRTAADAYVFLLNWMERFPEYKGRDFYIAGESYAGHYVPQLADVILRNRNQSSGSSNTVINLKGIMMGNAVFNDETDARGMYDYFWTHALISDATIEAIDKNCNFSPNAVSQTTECSRALQDAQQLFGNINIYNIYAPLCSSSTPHTPSIENFDPCTDEYVSDYLNHPEVQRALHANITNLKYSWSACSQAILAWQDSPSTVLPIIRYILGNNVQVLVYSGDIDGRVPVTSTRYTLNQLKLSIKTPWKPWFVNNEVGGFGMVYEGNITFATVRGAGHEVPSYQPVRALALIKSFLQGSPLPS